MSPIAKGLGKPLGQQLRLIVLEALARGRVLALHPCLAHVQVSGLQSLDQRTGVLATLIFQEQGDPVDHRADTKIVGHHVAARPPAGSKGHPQEPESRTHEVVALVVAPQQDVHRANSITCGVVIGGLARCHEVKAKSLFFHPLIDQIFGLTMMLQIRTESRIASHRLVCVEINYRSKAIPRLMKSAGFEFIKKMKVNHFFALRQ